MKLRDYQIDAVKNMKNGCILNGGVGSGKSLTSLSYYYLKNSGDEKFLKGGKYVPMSDPPKDLYIITTARKETLLNGKENWHHFYYQCMMIRTYILIKL